MADADGGDLRGGEKVEAGGEVAHSHAEHGAPEEEGGGDVAAIAEPGVDAAGTFGREFAAAAEIDGEDAGAGLGELVEAGGGGGLAVAVGEEDGGAAGFEGVGDGEDGGDLDAGLAFISEFFEAVGGAGEGSVGSDFRRVGGGVVGGEFAGFGEDLGGGESGPGDDAGLVQREDGFAGEGGLDLAGGGALELFFGRELDVGFGAVVFALREPAGEPGVGGESTGLRVPVAVVGFDHAELVGLAELVVDAEGFRVGGAGSADGEEVADGGEDEIGLAVEGVEEVGEVEAGADPRGEVLFGVLRTELGEQGLGGGDVAARGGDFEAVVDGGEIGREGAAARVAGDADAVGVDFGAGGEIVEGADAVVDHVAGDIVAGEEGLGTEHGVLGGGADELGRPGVGVEEL